MEAEAERDLLVAVVPDGVTHRDAPRREDELQRQPVGKREGIEERVPGTKVDPRLHPGALRPDAWLAALPSLPVNESVLHDERPGLHLPVSRPLHVKNPFLTRFGVG